MDPVVPSATPPSSVAAAAPQSNAVISSDFETFLKMLTAQARYQDPLEPIDSAEYAAQLAQFSMVEQQVLSNDLLSSLGAQIGSGNLAQLAGWVGMEALTTAPAAFDGTPIEILPNPAPLAEEAILSVRDTQGREIQRIALPLSNAPVLWAGVSSDGTPFPPGTYSFTIESRAQGAVIGTEPAQSYARISEARVQGEETRLILQGGSSIAATEVSGLRAPQGS